MSWCPVCKNEYVEGRKTCADCGVELVETLEEAKSSPVIFGEQEQMEKLKEFLLFNHIESAFVSCDETEGVYELFVSDGERQKAAMAVKVFLQEEEAAVKKDVLLQNESDIAEHPLAAAKKGIYQNSAKRAEENRSSAYMLLIIGGIGLIAVILVFMDIIPLPVNIMNKYMICGVMGGMFVLFTVMGFVSMKSSKVLAQKAESENNLASEIKKWCEENLTEESIDEDLFGNEENAAEEMKYFKRAEKMKMKISHQFMNLDEDFLDSFVDDYYPDIFERDN